MTLSPTLLYLHNGLAFYRGNVSAVNPHQHHAIELVVSEHSGQFWQGADCLHRGQIALLGADVPHRFIGSGWQWFVYAEPESPLGLRLLQSVLHGQPVVSLPDSCLTGLSIADADNATELKAILDKLLQRLLPDAEPTTPACMDERIERVLGYIKVHIAAPLSLNQLTGEACLSEGRLIHLFKEQVGIPIRKYILWNRLQTAVQGVLTGQNLTQAAHHAGFADSAHFSRTFSDMFGIRPSDVLLK